MTNLGRTSTWNKNISSWLSTPLPLPNNIFLIMVWWKGTGLKAKPLEVLTHLLWSWCLHFEKIKRKKKKKFPTIILCTNKNIPGHIWNFLLIQLIWMASWVILYLEVRELCSMYVFFVASKVFLFSFLSHFAQSYYLIIFKHFNPYMWP